MKLESLVMAYQNHAVKTSRGLGHSAGHITKVGCTRSRHANRKQASAQGMIHDWGEVVTRSPQVLLRLPCYDFTPIMNHTLGACFLAVGMATSSTTHFRDVTGGVYKARERIHGVVLIRHY